ncbi:hypothetical protein L6164_010786 [Bauhinia variegata]|uniref:Uncharacterized protein n=1 Tax=Bauhinia variegata TaxID=167791 RepID=A0ACB9P3B1_BAUVA|nr:hypothetical protein L6164_010786 [Bauhinia variegata]
MYRMSLTPPLHLQGIHPRIHRRRRRQRQVQVIKATSTKAMLHLRRHHPFPALTTITMVVPPSSEPVWPLSVAAAFWTNVASSLLDPTRIVGFRSSLFFS